VVTLSDAFRSGVDSPNWELRWKLLEAADRSRINVNEDYELRYWTKALGVSEEELREAVRKYGTSAEAVRSHLGKR